MSTRGAYGFYKNGINKITIAGADAYPDGLGTNIINFLRENSIKDLNLIFDKISMIDAETYADTHGYLDILSNEDGLTVYTETKVDIMVEGSEFLKDGLFCEWAYIINLDKNELEVYVGGVKYPEKNRYYTPTHRHGYYNCRLLKSYPLEFLEEDIISDINESSKKLDDLID